MKLVHWLFCAALLTASWDTVFVLHLAGTLRLSQLLVLPICLAAAARVLQDGRILWPRGATVLAIWIVSQFLLIPLSGNRLIASEFFVLLVYTVAIVFAVIQLYGQIAWLDVLMRVYLLSYVVTAVIGIVQFILPAIGIHVFPVSQWIIHGRIARINAFSYEPSYFSTYMILGWITLLDLRKSKARLTQSNFWKWATILTGVSLVLCTSKTGWLVMCLELLVRATPHLIRAFRSFARQLVQGRMLLPLPSLRGALTATLVSVGLIAGAYALFSRVSPLAFLSGSGIAGTPAHSVTERSANFHETLQVFLDHPFIGPSLGGVPIEMAARKGVTVTDSAGVRVFWGLPVILDVLTSTGVILFIPFLIFLYTGTFGAMRFARNYWPDERAKWLRALGRAMVFEWIMLLSEQNVLRIYLWYHFAITLLVAYHLEFAPPLAVQDPSPAISPVPSAGFLEAGATS
jgi:hypothetical protein